MGAARARNPSAFEADVTSACASRATALLLLIVLLIAPNCADRSARSSAQPEQSTAAAQVVPFLRPLLEFAKQRGDAAAKARAAGGLKALRNPSRNVLVSTAVSAATLAAATAAEAAGDAQERPRQRKGQAAESTTDGGGGGAPSSTGRGKGKKGAAAAAAAAGAKGARGGEACLPGLDSASPGIGFEQLLHMNAQLQDAMPAYEGLGPRGPSAGPKRVEVGRIDLKLPGIVYDPSAAASRAAREGAQPAAAAVPGAACARAWLDFMLDKESVMAALRG